MEGELQLYLLKLIPVGSPNSLSARGLTGSQRSQNCSVVQGKLLPPELKLIAGNTSPQAWRKLSYVCAARADPRVVSCQDSTQLMPACPRPQAGTMVCYLPAGERS